MRRKPTKSPRKTIRTERLAEERKREMQVRSECGRVAIVGGYRIIRKPIGR